LNNEKQYSEYVLPGGLSQVRNDIIGAALNVYNETGAVADARGLRRQVGSACPYMLIPGSSRARPGWCGQSLCEADCRR